jgi:adenine-specific DNA-methyltransferase
MTAISAASSATLSHAQTAANCGLELFALGNRRYLGSKTKLLNQIDAAVQRHLGRPPTTVLDAFAGSGVVAAHFAQAGAQTISSDLLLHNVIGLKTFLNYEDYDYAEACELLAEMAAAEPKDGYITETFGGKYFSIGNARKLDAAREFVENAVQSEAVKNFALTSLIYAADKIAQTVGHYDAFFNRESVEKPLVFRAPLPVGSGSKHIVLHDDANLVVKANSTEVLYVDPPYNSRQYSDAYHVLENIVRWEKPEVFGIARKMDRTQMKSKYSTRAVGEAFSGLIQSATADLIVMSYSNTGNSRASRSNNLLTDEEILSTLNDFGKVSVEEINFKEFSVGRTSTRDHQERLFLCVTGKK